LKKLVLLILFVLAIVAIYTFTPARDYLSQDGLQKLQTIISSQGLWAPALFSIIYIFATVFALPGSVLTILGGLLFGALWGTAINLTSATIGASFCFMISRYVGREFVEKLLRKKSSFEGLDEKIGKHGFYSVLYLRLIPLFPFNALNFGLGLTKVSFKDYVLASFIGMLPGCFAYTALGAAGQHVSLTSLESWQDYRVWGPFALVILLTLIPKLIKKR